MCYTDIIYWTFICHCYPIHFRYISKLNDYVVPLENFKVKNEIGIRWTNVVNKYGQHFIDFVIAILRMHGLVTSKWILNYIECKTIAKMSYAVFGISSLLKDTSVVVSNGPHCMYTG